MRQFKWRNCLLGDYHEQEALHANEVCECPTKEYTEIIHSDLLRTFPKDAWFKTHFPALSKVLNSYAYTNKAMGYMQGMSFPMFVLYRTFYEDDPDNAFNDAYYAFHSIINVVRPIYPLSSTDPCPKMFNSDICTLIILIVGANDMKFARTLRDHTDILKVMIYQCVPTLFTNKFNYEDCCVLFDFILHKSGKVMFENILRLLVATVLVFKPVFEHMADEHILELIATREYHSVYRIVSLAGSIYM